MKKILKMNKKENMAYWDAIEDIMLDAVKRVTAFSTSTKKMTEVSEIEDDILGIAQDALDEVIDRLTEVGYFFPYVDEDF